MSRIAHSDAPEADPLTREIYNLVRRQAPVAQVKAALFSEFDIVSRVLSAPGYIQPNGFATFKLGGAQGDQLLRFHFWPQGMPQIGDTAGVHDHVFDFTSLVLDGNGPMINTLYTPTQSPDGDLTLYEVAYTSAKTSTINELGKQFRAVAADRQSIAPGAYYTVKAGDFHTSQIDGDAEAITLLATSLNPAFANPRFLAHRISDENYNRPPLTDSIRHAARNRLLRMQAFALVP